MSGLHHMESFSQQLTGVYQSFVAMTLQERFVALQWVQQLVSAMGSHVREQSTHALAEIGLEDVQEAYGAERTTGLLADPLFAPPVRSSSPLPTLLPRDQFLDVALPSSVLDAPLVQRQPVDSDLSVCSSNVEMSLPGDKDAPCTSSEAPFSSAATRPAANHAQPHASEQSPSGGITGQPRKNKPVRCPFCDLPFPCLYRDPMGHLYRHIISHGRLKCKRCPAAFLGSFSAFERHWHKRHGIKKPYTCCGRAYRRKKYLTHLAHVHVPASEWLCRQCGYRISAADIKSKDRHLKQHRKNNLVKCGKCGFETRDSFVADFHALKHSALDCDDCERPIATVEKAYQHFRDHQKRSEPSGKWPKLHDPPRWSLPVSSFGPRAPAAFERLDRKLDRVLSVLLERHPKYEAPADLPPWARGLKDLGSAATQSDSASGDEAEESYSQGSGRSIKAKATTSSRNAQSTRKTVNGPAVRTPAVFRGKDYLTEAEVEKVFEQSSGSQSLLAKNLVCRIYTEEERENRNCSGIRGKRALSPTRLAWVEKMVRKLSPPLPKIAHEIQWKKCIQAIDKSIRRLEQRLVLARATGSVMKATELGSRSNGESDDQRDTDDYEPRVSKSESTGPYVCSDTNAISTGKCEASKMPTTTSISQQPASKSFACFVKEEPTDPGYATSSAITCEVEQPSDATLIQFPPLLAMLRYSCPYCPFRTNHRHSHSRHMFQQHNVVQHQETPLDTAAGEDYSQCDIFESQPMDGGEMEVFWRPAENDQWGVINDTLPPSSGGTTASQLTPSHVLQHKCTLCRFRTNHRQSLSRHRATVHGAGSSSTASHPSNQDDSWNVLPSAKSAGPSSLTFQTTPTGRAGTSVSHAVSPGAAVRKPITRIASTGDFVAAAQIQSPGVLGRSTFSSQQPGPSGQHPIATGEGQSSKSQLHGVDEIASDEDPVDLDKYAEVIVKSDEPQKSFECGYCGKRFPTRRRCRKHIRVVHSARRYLCKCGKAFKTEYHLGRHVKVCSGSV